MAQPFSIAKAYIRGSDEYPYLYGEAGFFETAHGIKIKGKVCGLPQNGKGFYGFHLHEGRLCEPERAPETFDEAGSHYNPTGTPHPLHAGDFPVLMANKNGYCEFSFLTDRIQIEEIIGRTLIIHHDPDDYKSQPAGDAGKRIACGIIERIAIRI